MITISRIKTRWQQFRWKKTAIAAAAGIIIVIIITALNRPAEDQPTETPLPTVQVASINQLARDARLERTGILEPTLEAPLIARTGGRVTGIKAAVGDTVSGGQVIIEIDGASSPSVARAQAAGAFRSTVLFNNIQKQAAASVANAVQQAEQNLAAVRAGQEISADIRAAQIESAAQAVEQAKQQVLTTSATREGLSNVDDIQVLIEAAQIGVKAAQLAQEQSELSTQLAGRQQSDAIRQAQLALTNAQIGKARAEADLASQHANLNTQLSVASEQVRASQVIAPFAGEVTGLTVRLGSYLTPGQQIGSVIGSNNSTAIRTEVPASVKNSITANQTVSIKTARSEYVGTITNIASSPSQETLLWQVDMGVLGSVLETDLYKSATVSFPLSSSQASTLLIPLDALNVRTGNIVILTVEEDGIIHEQAVTVLDYHGNFAEVSSSDIPPDALIVITGNRGVTEGSHVTLSQGSE